MRTIFSKVDRLGRTVHHTDPYVLVMRHVERAGDCLVYTGPRNAKGYGVASRSTVVRGTRMAHRVVWEHHNGPIPAGLLVMHSCDNPPCVEIGHLSAGTPAANSHDMVGKGRSPRSLSTSNGKAKLTDDQVRQIRALRAGGDTFVAIGERFDISPFHASQIVHGRRRETVI